MSVANRVTYFLEDFILEGGKVGYGGAYLAGQRVVGCAVLVQIPGNLVEVAADPAVLGGQLPDSGEQFIIDRRHMDNGAYGGAPYRLPEKFGLADTIGRKPRCEVGVFIFGQPGFHNAAAVGCVVFLSHGRDLLSCRMSAAGISGASRKAGFGEGTPQQVSREGQNRRIADFGTVVETCSK